MKILAKRDINAGTSEEVITLLANILRGEKLVKDTYLKNVLEREKVYPTGLPLEGGIDVALPHGDVEHCLGMGMAVGVLEKPVVFYEMGSDPKEHKPVNARIVIALAVNDKKLVVPNLGRIVENVFMKPEVVKSIVEARDELETASILHDALGV